MQRTVNVRIGTAPLPPGIVRLLWVVTFLFVALPLTLAIGTPVYEAFREAPAGMQLLSVGLSILAVAALVAYADRAGARRDAPR